MRILGPDGLPIPDTPALSPDVVARVASAQELAVQGEYSDAVQQLVLAFQKDVSSDLVLDATVTVLRMMAKAVSGGDSHELDLFEAIRANNQDAGAFFAIGEHFLRVQQPLVARPFLARARELSPNDTGDARQALDVAWAQVLMDSSEYQEAIAAFHDMNDKYGGLPAWLVLELAECYALSRMSDDADAIYALATEDACAAIDDLLDVRDEVGDLMARVRDFAGENMDLRDWHYVQTRGMLIETNPDENSPGERFFVFEPDADEVAYIVSVAAAMLDQRGYSPRRILWLGSASAPLAHLFGQWWNIHAGKIREYRNGDNSDNASEMALLVISHSDDLAGIEDEEVLSDLAVARAGLVLFTLDVQWAQRQVLTPDIAGFMSHVCALPWEPELAPGLFLTGTDPETGGRDATSVGAEIARGFPAREDANDTARDMLADYDICSDLILDHRDGTLNRKPLPCHSPVRSPRPGF